MFRTLATRLVATYVFAAIVLIFIVSAAFTAFALSMFGLSAHETADEVTRQVPEEVRLELLRSGSLTAAAEGIARHLVRPGVRIAVLSTSGGRTQLLAVTLPESADGGPQRIIVPERMHFGPPPPGSDVGPPPGGERPHRYEHMDPFPYSLNTFLHLEPRSVAFTRGRVEIFPDPAPLVRAINAFWLAMLPIGVFVVLSAWVLGRYITSQALRPLRETTASLERFGAGDFTPRPVVATDRNEIGELVRAYNAAAAQVSAAFDERRVAEFEMRQFIADAGHELRTPLTVIMGFVDVLRRRNAEAGTTKIYDTMQTESRRMKTLIDKLIVLARLENAGAREQETVDLGQVAGNVVNALQALGGRSRIELQVEPDADALVRGDEAELHDALSNLVENALKYAPGSPVRVGVRVAGGSVLVEVSDEGPGIAQDEQTQVFARFYRGRDREEAEGFGLGLAIAKRAVERAGGELSLESAPGAGSRFTIRIPSAPRGERLPVAV